MLILIIESLPVLILFKKQFYVTKFHLQLRQMKTRTRLEIACDILFFVGGEKAGARPTHILYKANLSPKLMQKYMRMLAADRMVKRAKAADGVRYKLTRRGVEFLGKAKELDGMCSFIELTPANRKAR